MWSTTLKNQIFSPEIELEDEVPLISREQPQKEPEIAILSTPSSSNRKFFSCILVAIYNKTMVW